MQPVRRNKLISGLLGATILLSVIAYIIFKGAQSVSAESKIRIPETVESIENTPERDVLTIYVDENDSIFINKGNVASLEELESFLQSIEDKDRDKTVFILRLDINAKHSLLVSIRNMLNQHSFKSKIELVRR